MHLPSYPHHRIVFRGEERNPKRANFYPWVFVYLRARLYQFHIGCHSQSVRRHAGLSPPESCCSHCCGRNYGFSGPELFWPLGTADPFRPNQACFKKLWRLLRDLLHGPDPRDCGSAMSRAFYLRAFDICGAERGSSVGVPLFLCAEPWHGTTAYDPGHFFRGAGKTAYVRGMDVMDQKALRLGPYWNGRLSIAAFNAATFRENGAFWRYPGRSRVTPRVARQEPWYHACLSIRQKGRWGYSYLRSRHFVSRCLSEQTGRSMGAL